MSDRRINQDDFRALARGEMVINIHIINFEAIICKYSRIGGYAGCIMGGGVATTEGLVGKNPAGFLRSADTDRLGLAEERRWRRSRGSASERASERERTKDARRGALSRAERLRGRRKDGIDDVRNGRLSQSVRRLGFNASGVLNAPSTSCISDSAFRLSPALIADSWYRWLSRR